MLQDHWSKVFEDMPTDNDVANEIASHVPEWKKQSYDLPGLEEFKALVMKTSNSAPGPDGVPYGFWRLLFDHVGHHLYRYLSFLWQGGDCPDGLNDSYTFSSQS